MPDPSFPSVEFSVNDQANRLHEQAFAESLSHHLSEAERHYEAAVLALANEKDSTENRLQLARIKRDYGFNFLRVGIDRVEARYFEDAEQILQESALETQSLLRTELELSPAQSAELYSEHGATLCLLGRSSTAHAVVITETPHIRIGKKRFQAAYEVLSSGSNGYYRVANAMTAARHMFIPRAQDQVAIWLNRAQAELDWTAVHDHSNSQLTLGMMATRQQALVSQQAAEDSVKEDP